MASNIVLKTYKGGTVTPQNDAIVQETAIPSNGIFKGCNVSYARGNVLRVSQGFGMIKGRFFEVYDCEVDVQLAEGDARLYGRLYVHMDLSNADEPIQLLVQTGEELPQLEADSDVNYNNSAYDIELATFRVTSSELSNLEQTFVKISSGSGGAGGGGQENIQRATEYEVGDMTRCINAPGWVTLVCIQAGETALTVPAGYAKITAIGDQVVDGTAVFQARNIIEELDEVQASVEQAESDIQILYGKLSDDTGLTTVLCSLEEYAAMEGWDDSTIYLCYYQTDPGKIVRIYMGENKVFSDGVTVTYQVDTGEATSTHVDDKADALLSAPTPTKDGYKFVGWRKDTQANGTVISSCIVEDENNFTLYAVFERSISIGMYPSGGTLIDGKTESTISVSCYYNNGNSLSGSVTIPACPYEKTDESFCGWEVNGTLYKPGEKANFTEDSYLVPQWITTVYDFPYTGSYIPFTIPADGIYEFELWGAAGFDATKDSLVAKGGKGGHAKGYKKMTKGEVIYVYNGGMPTRYSSGGSNGGGSGYTYSSNGVGASGGGATHVITRSGSLGASSTSTQSTNYNNREKEILIVAGGGGGGGITSAGVVNPGGDGGGERGGDGSDVAMGGRQISTGSSAYTNFGYAPSYSGSSTTYSGGGGGYFGGQYDTGGDSGAGGSGYVGGVKAFTHNGKFYPTINEAGVNEGDGYSFIRYVECI